MSRTQWILALSRGIRERSTDFRFESFARQFVPVPPPDEQAAIVKFLDYANGKIERAIRAKRKLIGLLNEQKQAIIHRAVTRGLDPNVKLKPSGIPWLGDVPEHWEVRRLRHLIKGKLSYGANAAAEFTNPDWPRYIRITDFRTDGTLKSDTFRSLPPAIASDYMVIPGDMLFARSGATVGKAFLVLALTGSACHAGYLIRARPDRSVIYPEYLFAFTQGKAFFAWKDSTFNTATIQNIGADKYANLTVSLPPLHEQRSILEFLSVEQRPLLATISRLEREIELLREYRTTLTAEVVTGKLDVREAAKRLPDQTEELLPPDESLDDLVDDEITEEDEA
jgi:type I restriction enzyme S subunit